MEGDAKTYRRELEMRWHRRGLKVGREMGKVHEAGEGTGPGAQRQCACSAFLLIGFFATASLELCS